MKYYKEILTSLSGLTFMVAMSCTPHSSIKRYPYTQVPRGSSYVDDAFNKAYLFDMSGRKTEALEAYNKFLQEYHDEYINPKTSWWMRKRDEYLISRGIAVKTYEKEVDFANQRITELSEELHSSSDNRKYITNYQEYLKEKGPAMSPTYKPDK